MTSNYSGNTTCDCSLRGGGPTFSYRCRNAEGFNKCVNDSKDILPNPAGPCGTLFCGPCAGNNFAYLNCIARNNGDAQAGLCDINYCMPN
jgi:hypothetical protein